MNYYSNSTLLSQYLGYSKTEVKRILTEINDYYYKYKGKDNILLFIQEMRQSDSMIEIADIWEKHDLASSYMAVDAYIQKLKKTEKMYGKLQTIRHEKKQIENLLGI